MRTFRPAGLSIPAPIRAELTAPAPVGHRHKQAIRIAIALIGQGFAPEATFTQLRGMYGADVSNRELTDVIAWSTMKARQPCSHVRSPRHGGSAPKRFSPETELSDEQKVANVSRWLGRFHCHRDDLWHASPWRPLENWRSDSLMLFAALYGNQEYINVVTDFTIEEIDGRLKAHPKGAGTTLLRDDWMRRIRDNGTPESTAGGWMRPNPVQQAGSGRNGAIMDLDVTSYRFCLLESDALPIEVQLSLWARLPLPIAAIVESGGRSVHAWVMFNCSDAADFRAKARRLYDLLGQFGICTSNKNPSRLARLPGAQRKIGATEDGAQRLLYLNPEPAEAAIF